MYFMKINLIAFLILLGQCRNISIDKLICHLSGRKDSLSSSLISNTSLLSI